MLTFITEQKDGEPDTITSHMHKNLTVKVEYVIVFELKAPKAGWAYQQFAQINLVYLSIL